MMAGSEAPIGRNILDLVNIQQSENYSCIAASTLGTIEATTFVRVQGTSFCSPFCSCFVVGVLALGRGLVEICKYYLRLLGEQK